MGIYSYKRLHVLAVFRIYYIVVVVVVVVGNRKLPLLMKTSIHIIPIIIAEMYTQQYSDAQLCVGDCIHISDV